MAKGDEHKLIGNLAFDHYEKGNDDQQSSGGACNICVLRYIRNNPIRCNTGSTSVGNIGRINGGATPSPFACRNKTDANSGKLQLGWRGYDVRDDPRIYEWCNSTRPEAEDCTDPATCLRTGKRSWPTSLWPIVGHDNIQTDDHVRDLLRDPDSHDLRPKTFNDTLAAKGGPYGRQAYAEGNMKVGNDASGEAARYFYWIPGRIGAQASMPVPYDGAPRVRPTTDLIFLPAQGCQDRKHWVAVGSQPNRLFQIGRLKAGANIWVVTDPNLFRPGRKYYWRIDCQTAAGERLRGALWSFTVCGERGEWKNDEAHSKMALRRNRPEIPGEEATC